MPGESAIPTPHKAVSLEMPDPSSVTAPIWQTR